MASRLERILNWEELAKESRYRVVALARACLCSERQLNRFFLDDFQDTPSDWLHKRRMSRAVDLIQAGASTKEIAWELGYSDACHFCSAFQREYHTSPQAYLASRLNPVPIAFLHDFRQHSSPSSGLGP